MSVIVPFWLAELCIPNQAASVIADGAEEGTRADIYREEVGVAATDRDLQSTSRSCVMWNSLFDVFNF